MTALYLSLDVIYLDDSTRYLPSFLTRGCCAGMSGVTPPNEVELHALCLQ